MDERDKLIAKLIEEKGGSYNDYLNLLDSIAYHESAHTMDPTIKQVGGGPGRGKYQFETGKNAGAITAAKRTKKYFEENNIPVPDWLKEISSKDDLDVTNLTSQQQDILFLGNMRKHPKANFKNLWDGKETIEDFWANYHWAGPDKDRKKRVDSFRNSLSNFNDKKKINIPSTNEDIKNMKFNDLIPSNIESTAFNEESLNFKPTSNLIDYINLTAFGGQLNGVADNRNINEFNAGGLHEQNPLGGIPQGVGNNGKQNTVEEGETSFELKRGKYIFSNRLTI